MSNIPLYIDVLLEDKMGFFGGAHIDSSDNITGLSCMISAVDLPDDYDSGQFHLLELGVFISLKNFKILYFSGLRQHGGTIPRSPPSISPVSWAYRFITIWRVISIVVQEIKNRYKL